METPEQREKRRASLKAWRAANPDKVRAQERRYRERHPDRVVESNRKTRERLGPEYWQRWQQERKATVIERYGGRCICCSETHLAFLSIDHEHGGGHQERKALGVQGTFRKLFESPDRLPGYRVLCMNCQFGTRFGRTCPHQLI